MKLLTFFKKKPVTTPSGSEFSRFFREASSREKKKVYMKVAKKAIEEQQKILSEYKEMVTR
jgi:histone H3/H4